MHFRYRFAACGATLLFLGCSDQRRTVESTAPDPRWAAIDSLDGIGQYATALERTEVILDRARTGGDWRTEFKAWMYRSRFQQATGVDQPAILSAIEQRAAVAPAPLAQVLQSVAASKWWDLYQQRRWAVLERTATTVGSDDPETWGQQRFMDKVIAGFRASLTPGDSLMQVTIDGIGDLLLGDERARPLRPTLFDLLAHRALQVFTSSETRVTEPAWRFTLDDPRAFELFETFAHRPLAHRDSTSWEFQALVLYQRLERAHLHDNRPDALVDVMLERLSYVHDRSILPDRDTLLLRSLEELRTRLTRHPAWSEVTLAIARWHDQEGTKYDRLAGEPWKWEKHAAVALCDSAIQRFPGSFGAINAAHLKERLLEPSMGIRCEEATLPDAPFMVALTYTNVPKAWIRIVPDPAVLEASNPWDPEHGKRLANEKAVLEWNVDLPDDGDHQTHMTELPVTGLPAGRYALLASPMPSFRPGKDLIAFTTVECTRFSVIERRDRNVFDLQVLDRYTGAPIPDVQVTLYSDNQRGNGLVKLGETRTNSEGRLKDRIHGSNGRYVWKLVSGDDRHLSSAGYAWMGEDGVPEDSVRTFLFTDRAIYRPGQQILFKGIVTVKRGRGSVAKAGYRTTVTFFDVNGQVVDSVKVTCDAFGSFHAAFRAPAGTLTGRMRIEEAHGVQGVQVEEYQRPTFEVSFDPVGGEPELDQDVRLSGMAHGYAGVPLDGAEVQWNVERRARMPWWCGQAWRGLPWGQGTRIASGTATCDAEGRFSVVFHAQADPGFPRGADPTFHFSVTADATDINGETQSGTIELELGYRTIDIDLGLPEGDAVDRTTTDSIGITVRNLNGEALDVPVHVRIARLIAPARPLRERRWERPDRFVMGKEEHDPRYKDDAYDNEADPLSWPSAAVVAERSAWSTWHRAFPLDGADQWEVGSYLLEVTAKDAHGRTVIVKKPFNVYDPTVQNTGFVGDAFRVVRVKTTAEPGEKAVLLLSSALPEARVLMEIERQGVIAVSRWFELRQGQQRVELPVLEGDRGGFFVHLLCVERGLGHNETVGIEVPWSNERLTMEWMSFRDALMPGDQEEWRLRISGPHGERVAAQLLTTMYDASLDHFAPHDWSMDLRSTAQPVHAWSRMEPFDVGYGQEVARETGVSSDTVRIYPVLDDLGSGSLGGHYLFLSGVDMMRSDNVLDKVVVNEANTFSLSTPEDPSGARHRPSPARNEPAPPLVRSDLRETAFFFPDLLTERDGSVVLRFKAPDALTRWNILGLAHTKDLATVRFTKEAVTRKPLMVFPNLPRFLRAGDRITLQAKINVMVEGRAEGVARLELFDPFTLKPVDKAFANTLPEQVFIASKGESAVAEWTITVPDGMDACGVRITAASKSGPHSTVVAADGEQHVLPVLTDRVLVTESLPLWTSKAGTKTFTLENLKSDSSSTLRHQSVMLEYSANPAWYAVQALPYLMEFPHACAEQVFSRYYANRLAQRLLTQRPAIAQVFAEWRSSSPDAFLGQLEKDPGLKNVLLAETPWVVDARNDRERKERIARLFDAQRMAEEEAVALGELHDLQLPSGAWPWWNGMREDRWITQHIVAGMGHLEALNAADLRPDGKAQAMLERAVQWLDEEVARDFQRLQHDLSKEDLDRWTPGFSEIQYLYARTFFRPAERGGATAVAQNFYKERLAHTWMAFGLQQQAMIALALHRMDDRPTAKLIMESLRQRAVQSEELGMYWKDFNSGMDWWNFPTETHALMVEAFHEVANDRESVDALRTHLLKLKQTTDWGTTKATAEACYALLLTGTEWLENGPMPVVKVGGTEVVGDREGSREPVGPGYFERTWNAAAITPSLGTVTVTTTSSKPSWGALHWQYFEQMDKVTAHTSPFRIAKQVTVARRTDQGEELLPVDASVGLVPGDRLVMRIELRTDRPLDHVHLKDLRAAGLEPTETISGCRYQGGLGYYQAVHDASIDFFFDRIPAGTYVFEYSLRVGRSGEMSNGIATAESMYAPEFNSHSEGMRLRIGE